MSHRALIVGLGRIGAGYDLTSVEEDVALTHARALHGHPSFELVGGVDPDLEQRQRFERRYSVPAFATVGEALDVVDPTVAVVATPTERHLETVEELLDGERLRSILCEKPLAPSVEEGARILAACERHRCSLFVNYMRRCEPGAIAIRNRIASGEIAQPLKAMVWYSKGLRHNGSHFVNLLEFWLGRVTEQRTIGAGRRLAGGDHEPDVWFKHERGTAIFAAVREEDFSHYAIELVAGNGRLRYDRGGFDICWQPAETDPVFPGYRTLASTTMVIHNEMMRSQWHVADHWALQLDNKLSDICTGRSALETLQNLPSAEAA